MTLRIGMAVCSVNCSTRSFRWLCNYTFQLTLYFLLISDIIINMKISFSVAEIGGSKCKNQIFYVILLNTDISITTEDIATQFCMTIFSYEL